MDLQGPITQEQADYLNCTMAMLGGYVEPYNELKRNPSPRVSIFISHCYLEDLINIILKYSIKCPSRLNNRGGGQSFSQCVWIAYELNLIPQEMYDALSYMNGVRNDLVHNIQSSISDMQMSKIQSLSYIRKLQKSPTPRSYIYLEQDLRELLLREIHTLRLSNLNRTMIHVVYDVLTHGMQEMKKLLNES